MAARIIPEWLIEKMQRFLDDGKTGTLLLHVNQGHLVCYEIREAGRSSIASRPASKVELTQK